MLSQFLLCATFAIFLMVADARWSVVAPVRIALSAAISPLQMVAKSPLLFAQKVSSYFSSLTQAQKQAAQAERELAGLSLQVAALKLLQQENQALRRLMTLKQRQFPDALAAQVVYDGADPYNRKVIIDKGKLDGVRVGSPVLDTHGIMGQVTRVYLRSCEVSLLTSQDLSIPLRNQRTAATLVAYGAPNVAGGRLELRYVASNADIQVGDVLLTSGVDGVYPPLLQVAKVEKMERRTDSAFARVYAKPFAQMHSQSVLIISPGDLNVHALTQEPPISLASASLDPSASANGKPVAANKPAGSTPSAGQTGTENAVPPSVVPATADTFTPIDGPQEEAAP